jgi:CubicO group peptidase (beta-lactamase class C family)
MGSETAARVGTASNRTMNASPADSISRWPRLLSVLESGKTQGLHSGAQVAITVRDQVFTLAVGDAAPGVPMHAGSIGPWLSSGKPLTAVALARFVEAGKLDWDDAVTRWIPEFGGGGKDGLTLRHLLTHTGGFRDADRTDPAVGWEDSVAAACAAPLEPDWIPGETAGYHANGSWFILGEILQRASGRPFVDVLQTEVIEPLQLGPGWFGINPMQRAQRANDWVVMERTGRSGRSPDPVLNHPVVISRCRPGSGLRTTATFLCRFYRALLAPPTGWLSPRTLDALRQPQRTGKFDRTFVAPIDLGLSFILPTPQPNGLPMPYGYGPHASARSFGHCGNQSSCAFADPDRDLAVAWICNGMPGEPQHQRRQQAINTALYEDLTSQSGTDAPPCG